MGGGVISAGGEGDARGSVFTALEDRLERLYRLCPVDPRRVVLGSDDDEVVVGEAAVVDAESIGNELVLQGQCMHEDGIYIAALGSLQGWFVSCAIN